MYLNEPIFAGKSAIDQLIEIIKVIGSPTQEDIQHMNPDCKPNSIRLPNIKPIQLKNVPK